MQAVDRRQPVDDSHAGVFAVRGCRYAGLPKGKNGVPFVCSSTRDAPLRAYRGTP